MKRKLCKVTYTYTTLIEVLVCADDPEDTEGIIDSGMEDADTAVKMSTEHEFKGAEVEILSDDDDAHFTG